MRSKFESATSSTTTGEHHQVEYVERFDGWAWPVASDGAGWAMALGGDVVLVARAA